MTDEERNDQELADDELEGVAGGGKAKAKEVVKAAPIKTTAEKAGPAPSAMEKVTEKHHK